MKTRKMRFGVELEVMTKVDPRKAVDLIKAAGINCEFNYDHNSPDLIDSWKIVPDGSLDKCGWEVVSPVLEDFDELEKVVEILRKQIKAHGGKKAGFHVHHDIRDFDNFQVQRLFNLYAKYEFNAIRSIINPRRYEDSYYCQDILADTVEINKDMKELRKESHNIGFLAQGVRERYRSLNIKSYIKHGTIEFRKHQGTTDIKEIEAWILLTAAIVEKAANEEEEIEILGLNDMLAFVDFIDNRKEYTLQEMLEDLHLENNKLIVSTYKRSQRIVKKAQNEEENKHRLYCSLVCYL